MVAIAQGAVRLRGRLETISQVRVLPEPGERIGSINMSEETPRSEATARRGESRAGG
jgi:hypothetical protein